MQLKLLNDDNRFYIILENPSEEEKQKAFSLASELFGLKRMEEKPIGVIPAKIEKEKISPEAKEVKKESDLHAKKTESKFIAEINSVASFNETYLSYNMVDENSKKWILIRCAKYIQRYFDTLDDNNGVLVKKFIQDFEPVLATVVEPFLKAGGYANLKGLLLKGKEEEIVSLYRACRMFLQKELKIK